MHRPKHYQTIAKLNAKERELFTMILDRSHNNIGTTYDDLFDSGIAAPRGTMPRLAVKLGHRLTRTALKCGKVQFWIMED